MSTHKMNYWKDRVHATQDPQDVKYSPVSFVVPVDHVDAVHSLMAPQDELVTAPEEATKPWTFVIKAGDVFPVQIIASIHSTLEASEFDAMMFPIVYRGYVVEERRMFRTKEDCFNVQRSSLPIFNLNPPTTDTA